MTMKMMVTFNAIHLKRVTDNPVMWVERLEVDSQSRSAAEVTGTKLAELDKILDTYEFGLDTYDDALVRRSVEDIKVADQDKLLVRFYGGKHLNCRCGFCIITPKSGTASALEKG